jgi:FkbM family methyltransferase
MAFRSFLYRQGQRLQYHVASSQAIKRIAEINRFSRVISICRNGYLINEIDLLLPKGIFDFIFRRNVFELFISVANELKGRYFLDNNRLYLKFDDLTIEVTSQSELFIIDEVFNKRCYNFSFPPNGAVRVIDVGMNVGISALFFAGLSDVVRVYGYEPFARTFNQAQVNFDNNKDRSLKIEPNNLGLGVKEEKVFAFYDASNSGKNTIVAENPQRRNGDKEGIYVKPASEVVASLVNKYPNDKFVLKVDTEGSEYLIFDSLFHSPLPHQVKLIMLEWHFRGARPLEKTLLANGFTVTSFVLNVDSGLIYAFR